jgi:uncharacterized membrane protein YgaE (UPF0421/DUF939 family)
VNKSTKNRNTYLKQVVSRLADKYQVSERMIIYSINGERTSETAQKISEEYKKISTRINNIINI